MFARQGIHIALALAIVIVALGDPVTAADDHGVIFASLVASGAGEKEYYHPDGWWQKIRYQCEVSFQLEGRFVGQVADTLVYQLTHKQGTVRFWGTAEDHFFGSTETVNFDESRTLDLQTFENSVLRYSMTRKRIVYIGYPLASQWGESWSWPYHLRFFDNDGTPFVRVFIRLPSKWWFDEEYDIPGTAQENSLLGVVYKDEDGNQSYDPAIDIPIKGATVSAILNGEQVAKARTDENGEYVLFTPLKTACTLRASLPSEIAWYDPEEKQWGFWSTIKGQKDGVQSPAEGVNVSVNYRWLNYGAGDLSWELWHQGPVFDDKENVVLVHGVILPIPFPPLGKHKTGEPDSNYFGNLHKLLQKKKIGQYNVWLFEYADKDIGYTYNHLEDYALYLKEARETIEKISQLNRSGKAGKKVSSIIAHSMGGVVSRKCLQDYPALRNIQLLTLATGHFGFETTHIAPGIPFFNRESIRDMLPDGSFLWNLNINYEQGSYRIASVVGTKDGMVKESSASLVESPDNPSESIQYPSDSYHFATIDFLPTAPLVGDHFSIAQIQSEDDIPFLYIKSFLLSNFSSFHTKPPEDWIPNSQGWRPYVIFCVASLSIKPEVALVKNGVEIVKYKVSDKNLATKGERGWVTDSKGSKSLGWIWMFNAPTWYDYDFIRIYYGKEKYLPVKITPGQSMIVKKLVGEPTGEEMPKVAFSLTLVSAEDGGWASAGRDGLYTKHSIAIPAGALSEDTVLEVSEPFDNHGLSSAVEFGPGGTIFSESATIFVEYKDSDIPPGHKEDEIKLLTRKDGRWDAVEGSTVNTEEHTVSGQVSHLSTYAAGIPSVVAQPKLVWITIRLPQPTGGAAIINKQLSVKAGSSLTVTAEGINSDSSKAVITPAWKVVGDIGTITSEGKLTVGRRAGVRGTLVASTESVSDSLNITILPGPLSRVVITPPTVTLKPRQVTIFRAIGYDAFNNRVTIRPLWHSVGGIGTINKQTGIFTAGTKTGTGYVIAYADSIFGDTGATLKGAAKVVVEQELPITYILSQNYPNPFNPETTIGYALPEVADIRLRIYDISGRAIRTLAQGYQQPGGYTVVWDGRDAEGRVMASGVYLYRLEVVNRGFVETRRMLLMR